MTVDPALAALFEDTATRAETAAGGIRDELHSLQERFAGVEARLDVLERRSGAIVVETRDPETGEIIDTQAKKAGVSIGTILAVIAALTPIYAVTIEVFFR